MPFLAGSLVQRGLDAYAQADHENTTYQVPRWGILMIGFTAMVFLFISAMVCSVLSVP
jgi:hypothetical protein